MSMHFGSLLLAVVVLLAAPGCSCQRRADPGAAPPATPAPAPPAPAPAPPAPAPPSARAPVRIVPTPLTACKADGDCVTTAGDCCGCNAGGMQAVVTRAKLDEFEAARTRRCTEAMCIAMMSAHPSCRQEARCVGGSCRLVDPPTSGGPASAPAPVEAPVPLGEP
jgi:hypothetical protein